MKQALAARLFPTREGKSKWSVVALLSLLSFVAVIMVGSLCVLLIIGQWDPAEFHTWVVIVCLGWIFSLFVWMRSGFYPYYKWKDAWVETIWKNEVFLNERGGIVKYSEKTAEFWRWDPLLDSLLGLKRVIFENICLEAQSTFQPISPNPKVRTFQYRVIFKNDPQTPMTMLRFLKFCELLRSFSGKGNLEEAAEYWLNYQLIEFNERYSQQLSQLYNWMNPEYQQKFQNLVQEFFRPLLADSGAAITQAEFKLAA